MSAEYLNELFNLDNQIAVVIGGTGELGGMLAEGIAQAGAHVVVAGRNAERGQRRVASIQDLGGQASFAAVEVGQRASMQALLDETVAHHGRVDCLVNGAGVNSAAEYFSIDYADCDHVLETNLRSTHWGCQIFGQHMAQGDRGGAILNIGSVTSFLPLSRVFAYSASKAAVLSLTQNLARELAPRNVRVNALCPGFFPAEQNRKILDAERTANIMRHTPMARFGDPRELVGAALLLLSPSAGSFMTGSAVYVDGGFTANTI